MMKDTRKVAKSFRLNRSTVALLETYAREHGITLTDVVELAIKRLCRQSATPATQQDLAALAEMIKQNQVATLAAIKDQPIQIQQTQRQGILKRLLKRSTQ